MALIIDGLIILGYFAIIMFIGLRMGRRENTLHDFALGGRRVPWWAVMASIIAAETSAATFLGAPGEGYENKSFAYVQLIIGLILGRVLVGYVFLKPYYTFKVYTVYDYLAVRFGPLSKNYVSALFLFMRTLASGTRMFVPAIAIVLAWEMLRRGGSPVSFKTGGSLTPYVIAIVVVTTLTCLYTAVGGIKAVIWTDVIQAALMFAGALVAVGTLLYHIAGDRFDLPLALQRIAADVPQLTGREGYFLTGFEPAAVSKYMATSNVARMTPWHYVQMVLASPYTLFSATIASTLSNMAAFGTDQDMVQRMLTAETYKKARRSLITAAIMDFPIATAFVFIGILLFVFYKHDPTFLPVNEKGLPVNSDVFGSYILNVMPVGIRGIVLAGVFATAMGSLSAALNALATSATNDWYIPYFARHRDGTHHVSAARAFTALFAGLMILIATAFAYAKINNPNVRIIPVVLGIAGFILGPMLGVFLLGMLTPNRGSDHGNMIAITVGLLATIYLGGLHKELADLLGFGSRIPPPVIKVSFTWFALIGATIVFAVGVLFRTPEAVVQAALRKATQSQADERPPSLRDTDPQPAFDVIPKETRR